MMNPPFGRSSSFCNLETHDTVLVASVKDRRRWNPTYMTPPGIPLTSHTKYPAGVVYSSLAPPWFSAVLAARSASAFQDRGTFQNEISHPALANVPMTCESSCQRSLLAAGFPEETRQSFCTHVRRELVAGAATYSESVMITIRSQPSPHHTRYVKADSTVRSSARLFVCGYVLPSTPLFSSGLPTFPESPSLNTNAKPPLGVVVTEPLSRHDPSVCMHVVLRDKTAGTKRRRIQKRFIGDPWELLTLRTAKTCAGDDLALAESEGGSCCPNAMLTLSHLLTSVSSRDRRQDRTWRNSTTKWLWSIGSLDCQLSKVTELENFLAGVRLGEREVASNIQDVTGTVFWLGVVGHTVSIFFRCVLCESNDIISDGHHQFEPSCATVTAGSESFVQNSTQTLNEIANGDLVNGFG